MCTRILYTNYQHQSFLGRNMDWYEPPAPDLWAFPKGMKRTSRAKNAQEVELEWTSDFSSVINSCYEQATSDGMNSEGLTVNLLWLTRSEFPQHINQGKKDALSLSIWAQYLLDKCRMVKDAIQAMDSIFIQSGDTPGEYRGLATCHLSVGDREGNSAIFEYLKGELHIHTNVDISHSEAIFHHYSKEAVRVMANDPQFDRQSGSMMYWQEKNNNYRVENQYLPALLPGANTSIDRFVRANYFTNQLPDSLSGTQALAGVAGVVNNVAQPKVQDLTYNSPDFRSNTQYSTFADTRNRLYFYRSTYSPFLIWIDLNAVPFDALPLEHGFQLGLNKEGVFEENNFYGGGNVTSMLKPAKPFTFKEANQDLK